MGSRGRQFFGRKRTTNKKRKLEESEVDKKGIHRKLVSPLLPFKKAALNALFCAFLLMNGVSIISSSSQLVSVEIGCYLEL